MKYLMVRHKVANFSEGKLVIDWYSGVQRNAGLKVERVLRSLDDPTEGVLWFQVTDIAKARGFVYSPEVPGAKQRSGVVDHPDRLFLS